VSFDLDSRRAFDVSDVFAVVVVGCFNDCEGFLSKCLYARMVLYLDFVMSTITFCSSHLFSSLHAFS